MKKKKPLKTAELVLNESTPFLNLKKEVITETALPVLVISLAPLLLAHTNQNQIILGTIVNTTLFLVTMRMGLINAIFISFIPSLVALTRGMLPPQAVMLLPFIILGNIAMVSTFFALKINPYGRILLSSLVKTIFMIIPLVIGIQISSSVAFMLSWPQLLTALLGGMVALGLNSFLKGKKLKI